MYGDAKMTTALLDRLTHYCHIVETGNESWRFKNSSAVASTRKKPSPKTGGNLKKQQTYQQTTSYTAKTEGGSILDEKPRSVLNANQQAKAKYRQYFLSFGKKGVRANMVCPGSIKTNMQINGVEYLVDGATST